MSCSQVFVVLVSGQLEFHVMAADHCLCCHGLQIKRCKTDSIMELEWDNLERPEATNLLTLYQLSTRKTKVGGYVVVTCFA